MQPPAIPPSSLAKAVALLADTTSGLTGPKIVNATNGHADHWGVEPPHVVSFQRPHPTHLMAVRGPVFPTRRPAAPALP